MAAGRRDVLVFDNGHDQAVRGFGIRKYRDGSATYIVKFAIGGRTRRLTLGPVRKGNLKMMRALADKAKAHARLGEDIVGDKKAAAKEQQAAESAATVGELVVKVLAEREEMTRKVRDGRAVTPTLRAATHEQNARYLQVHCKSLHRLVVGVVQRGAQTGVVDIDKRWTPINGHKLEVIARSHVVAVVDDVAKNRGKVSADRCRTALSTFFAWCIDQNFCDHNPTLGIKPRAATGGRERSLSDAELAEVWHATGDGSEYSTVVRLLLLSGQRREEVGALRWGELDLGERVLKLPAGRVKNGRAHDVPLSAEALAILKAVPRGDRVLVFGRGVGGYAGWSISKRALDNRINEARAKAGLEPMAHFTLHDLRRSFSTRCNELGLGEPWEVDACLNHVVGGTHGVYNRARHEAGKRKVLEAWGAHVGGLVSKPQQAAPAKTK